MEPTTKKQNKTKNSEESSVFGGTVTIYHRLRASNTDFTSYSLEVGSLKWVSESWHPGVRGLCAFWRFCGRIGVLVLPIFWRPPHSLLMAPLSLESAATSLQPLLSSSPHLLCLPASSFHWYTLVITLGPHGSSRILSHLKILYLITPRSPFAMQGDSHRFQGWDSRLPKQDLSFFLMEQGAWCMGSLHAYLLKEWMNEGMNKWFSDSLMGAF